MLQNCKYRLPCNWCDKYDRMCEAVLFEIEQDKLYQCLPNHTHNWEESCAITDLKTNTKYSMLICSNCGSVTATKQQIKT